MPDVISYLADVGTPATFEKIAALRGFTIIKKTRNPSLCVCGGGWQYHGYVSAHDDEYVGHLGFFVPGHRTKDSLHQKLMPDDHFDNYRWQKLGSLLERSLQSYCQYEHLPEPEDMALLRTLGSLDSGQVLLSFEEAAEIQHRLLTAEALRTRPGIFEECRKALRAVGRTPETLMLESERRAKLEIAKLRQK